MAELPRICLWVLRVEVCEQFVTGEIPGTRTNISHRIDLTEHTVMCGNMTMETLMVPLQSQETGGGFGRCRRAFVCPPDVHGVVQSGPNGALDNIRGVCHHHMAGNVATQFKIAVHDDAVGVLKGHHVP